MYLNIVAYLSVKLWGDIETPQHGNDSTRKRIKNTRKPLKNRFF